MCRIPFLVVHAVENSKKPVLPPAQKPVQAAAEFLRRDFARITRADRGDDVGKSDSGLETIQLAVKLRAFDREKFRRQIGQRKRVRRENALIGEIVNGQAGRRRIPPPFRALLLQHQRRHQAGLPVVDVHHVRPPRQIAREMRDAFGKENKPLGVVGIADVVFLVKSGAMVKFRLVNEINRQPLFDFERPQFRLHPPRAQRQIELPVHALDLRKSFADAAIQRRDDPRFVARARQRLAQRAHHVRQPAGFGERMDFAAGQKNSHSIYDLRFTRRDDARRIVNRKS